MKSATDKSSVPQKCYSCNAELISPIVCQGCNKLYPLPQSVDYFELLGLPRTYDIDVEALDARFVSVTKHVHPDYFTGAGEEMSRLATRLSAELNDAVKVLKDPVLRAGYLLELSGGPSASDDRTVPPEVLSETLMMREEIEEAQAGGDEAAIQSLHDSVERKRSELLNVIAALARKLPSSDEDVKRDLRRTLNAVKYYNNMQELLWSV